MSQYCARNGVADDWHLVNAGRFAMGGAGAFFVEATAVTRDGRGTLGDLGLWDDSQIEPLSRIAQFLQANDCVPGIQLLHAGRKSGRARPWEGGQSLPQSFLRGAPDSWVVRSVTDAPWAKGGAPCVPLSEQDLADLTKAWGAAAARAARAGFQVLEIHAAHGYLLNSFLSQISNTRTDRFGGDLEGRMRFPLMAVEAVRAAWPEHLPLSVRISAVDWVENGWSMEDSVVFARELARRGVDLIDCSSGGVVLAQVPNGIAYQSEFAVRIRSETGIPTMAVGHILDENHAADVLARGVDLVALGRQALINPNWLLHVASRMNADEPFSQWPEAAGWWLARRSISYPAGTNIVSEALGF